MHASQQLDYMNWDRDHKTPKSPGRNAGQNTADMGTDQWRTESSQKVRRNAQFRKPIAVSGRGSEIMRPTAKKRETGDRDNFSFYIIKGRKVRLPKSITA